MKKSVLVIVMACALVFAFTAVAYASTASGYITWSAAAPNDGAPVTPHKNYTTTTQKCIVCHAAHKAPITGQILLADTRANSCIYCHIGAGPSTIKVYGGVPSNYTTDTDNQHQNACADCHAVHGANTVPTTAGDLSTKIIRLTPASYSPQAGTGYSQLAGATYNESVSAFCSACHPYYTPNYEGTITGTQGVGGSYKGHIMTSDFAAYGNPNATVTSQVAWNSSQYCINCHDAGLRDQGTGTWADNFPHYTNDKRFMQSADRFNGTYIESTDAQQDGVCLKCHLTVGAGIGVTF